MCDTAFAPPSSTEKFCTLFGKNSDRQRNEAQLLEYAPGYKHSTGASQLCTYISVPQVRQTHSVLISRPFWMWGAEMGVNEHGVAIGNEALLARDVQPIAPALTGMDLLRLSLQRASSAAEAVEVLTDLLGKYGQGGNCGHIEPRYYNNGYLIVDAQEGFVLETAGKEWVIDRAQNVRAISNSYSIGSNPLRVSDGLRQPFEDGQASKTAATNFAELFTDPARAHIGQGTARRERSETLLRKSAGQLRVQDMMRILRDHGPSSAPRPWSAACVAPLTLCMHAGGPERPSQTVNSWVSEIGKAKSVHWVTGTAAPCISIFKPLMIGLPMPAHGPIPDDRCEAHSMWWRHEILHRAALRRDFSKFLEDIHSERDELESNFIKLLQDVTNGGDPADHSNVVDLCWRDATDAEGRWWGRMQVSKSVPSPASEYHATWSSMCELAGLK